MKGILFPLILVLLAVNFVSAGLDEDLVVYFPFDSVEGKKILDASGNDLHADVIANTDFVKGRYGDAIHIARDAQRTDCINVSSDSILKIESEITMMAWVYHEDWNEASGQWFDKGSHVQPFGYGMGVFKDIEGFGVKGFEKQIGLLLGGPEGTWIFFTDNPIADKGWHHITGTYDGEFAKIYLDGELISEDESIFKFATANDMDMRIGCVKDRPQFNFRNGSIDEVGVWQRALTEAEIKGAMEDIFAVSSKDKVTTTWADIKRQTITFEKIAAAP